MIRELTPGDYHTSPAVKAEVDALCERAGVNPNDVCRIDIIEKAVFYRWSELPNIVDGELMPEQTCTPIFLCELTLA